MSNSPGYSKKLMGILGYPTAVDRDRYPRQSSYQRNITVGDSLYTPMLEH